MEGLPLSIGIVAAVLVGFWLFKRLFRLAFYAAVIGAAAWYWYFQAR
jgi:hypothetical protein